MPRLSLGYRAQDHAGREVALGGFAPGMVERARDQKHDAELDRLRRRVRGLVRRGPSVGTILAVICVIGPLWVGLMALARLGMTTPTWLEGLAAMIGCAFMIIAFDRDERRGVRSRLPTVINAFLAAGRCPACGYSLAGVPPGESGRVCCPECAAEWRAEHVRSPIRPEPPLRPPTTWWGRTLAEESVRSRRSGGRAVCDAVGRALVMRDPALRRVRPEHVEALGESRVRALRREIRRTAGLSITPRIAAIVVLAVVPAILAGIGVAPPGPAPLVPRAAAQVAFGLMFAGIVAWALCDMLRTGSSIRADKLAEILVGHRICPACLGAMNGTVHNERRVRCPCCYAEWEAKDARNPGANSPMSSPAGG